VIRLSLRAQTIGASALLRQLHAASCKLATSCRAASTIRFHHALPPCASAMRFRHATRWTTRNFHAPDTVLGLDGSGWIWMDLCVKALPGSNPTHVRPSQREECLHITHPTCQAIQPAPTYCARGEKAGKRTLRTAPSERPFNQIRNPSRCSAVHKDMTQMAARNGDPKKRNFARLLTCMGFVTCLGCRPQQSTPAGRSRPPSAATRTGRCCTRRVRRPHQKYRWV